jgi:hypothetical protein
MNKPLVFEFDGKLLAFEMNKLDRDRLYGFKEIEVLDESGHRCEMATLADDGKTLIGRGGTGVGYLTADGNWCEKCELKPVDLEGKEIVPVISSFSAPIRLGFETTVEDYLNHNIRLAYLLTAKSDSLSEECLVDRLRGGAIFKFAYSFRGGLEADTGFLLMNDQMQTFLLVGEATLVDYVGLQQLSPFVDVEEEESDEPSELFDFGMI